MTLYITTALLVYQDITKKSHLYTDIQCPPTRFWFINQQGSFMNMFADGLAWSLILKFGLENIQNVGLCNFLSKTIPCMNTIRT